MTNNYEDRLVHRWLVGNVEPYFDKRFIEDSFANRKNKGTLAAVQRLTYFLKKPDNNYYCKLDIKAFFPSINRRIVLALWQKQLQKLPFNIATRQQLNHVACAILNQDPCNPPPNFSGNRKLLQQVPNHKSLFGSQPHLGMPIGSLTSQFFANVYLNELDQFVKHTLKVRYYIRYVDDFVLLANNTQQLTQWKNAIDDFLKTKLKLQLHPNKTTIQACQQGIDFLGYVIYPSHRLARQRSVRALRKRIQWFNYIVFPNTAKCYPTPGMGTWHRWLQNHQAIYTPGLPRPEFLQRMLATLNSYYGLYCHANTYTLRKHIYHKELGPLKAFFMPDGAQYNKLRIKSVWLKPRS